MSLPASAGILFIKKKMQIGMSMNVMRRKDDAIKNKCRYQNLYLNFKKINFYRRGDNPSAARRSTLLGYFVKFEAGWPMNGVFKGKPVLYLALGLDF